jgi:arylsulfatase A-like enzyme
MLTGQHPLVHRVFGGTQSIDAGRTRPLAARLREKGWSTAAFTGGGLVRPAHGFALGFDRYEADDPMGKTNLKREKLARSDDERSVARGDAGEGSDPFAPAESWLRAHSGQPFFAFLHTYFVHNYTPDPTFLAPLADPADRIADDDPMELRELSEAGNSAALARMKALYAATVAETDARLVGRTLALLDELALADATIVCIVSDHGEEHLEHGETGHGRQLFGECTRVPWILAGPGVQRGLVLDVSAELADVTATLAALAGLPPDPLDHSTNRLAAAFDADAAHVLVLGGLERTLNRDALVTGPWKLMRWADPDESPRIEVYDVSQDPREQSDHAAADAARARILQVRLDSERARLDELSKSLAGRGEGSSIELTPEQRAELRELGYLED